VGEVVDGYVIVHGLPDRCQPNRKVVRPSDKEEIGLEIWCSEPKQDEPGDLIIADEDDPMFSKKEPDGSFTFEVHGTRYRIPREYAEKIERPTRDLELKEVDTKNENLPDWVPKFEGVHLPASTVTTNSRRPVPGKPISVLVSSDVVDVSLTPPRISPKSQAARSRAITRNEY
jgi:hypothetical protein